MRIVVLNSYALQDGTVRGLLGGAMATAARGVEFMMLDYGFLIAPRSAATRRTGRWCGWAETTSMTTSDACRKWRGEKTQWPMRTMTRS